MGLEGVHKSGVDGVLWGDCRTLDDTGVVIASPTLRRHGLLPAVGEGGEAG